MSTVNADTSSKISEVGIPGWFYDLFSLHSNSKSITFSFLCLRILLLVICVKSSHVLSYFSKILLLLPVVKEKLVNQTEAVIANVAWHHFPCCSRYFLWKYKSYLFCILFHPYHKCFMAEKRCSNSASSLFSLDWNENVMSFVIHIVGTSFFSFQYHATQVFI